MRVIIRKNKKPMTKSSSLYGTAKRAAGGESAVREVSVNGLMRATESDLFASSSRRLTVYVNHGAYSRYV